MFTRDGCFRIQGIKHALWHCTSDGLTAIQTAEHRWEYYRLDWRTERYMFVGWTPEYADPGVDAFDKSETFVCR
jgi:hypothetical protein